MKNLLKHLENGLAIGGMKKDIVFLVISGIALLLSIFLPENVLPFDIAWIAIVLCGIPIILEAIIGLITSFDIKADVLVSLALIAAVCIGEYFSAGEVAFIMQLGAFLENVTVSKARAGIEKLVRLTPQTARVITDGKEKMISANKVVKGDVLRVLPGETIPVDGVILSGESTVNQSVMTGEPLPIDKSVGDEIFSGTVNQFGTFEMKATKIGEDSSMQRMIRLVQSADAGKAKIVTLADRWATWVVVIALLSALLTWFITGEIIRAVTILVVFCPCSLVLATPTAIMAGIGNVTKHGFLVREGNALERLAKIHKICFDKTGTLTYGMPKVGNVKSVSAFSEEEIFRFTAIAEQFSEHPLGKAVVRDFKAKYQHIPVADNFHMTLGKGVSATTNSKTILAGSHVFLRENHIIIPQSVMAETEHYIAMGNVVIYTAINQKLSGYLVLTDTLRKESQNMIAQIKSLQIEPVLLTGDNSASAQHIAKQLAIEQVKSQCLPEDKMEFIEKCQYENISVAMLGDGINDAPSLKKADVGIAMGSIGSDITVDCADIVLIDDEVKELPHLLAISRKMMNVIKINLTFSMILNFIAIILAITGILNPVVGALVHNAGSVMVIVHSALLLNWRKKNGY